jgi:hypothetical protein
MPFPFYNLRLRKIQTIAKPLVGPNHVVPEPPADGRPFCREINFMAYDLPEYEDRFAIVIDNVFSEEECLELLESTGASINDDGPHSRAWEVAQLGGSPQAKQYTDTSYRNSGRILSDDESTAGWILEKLRPYLTDIEKLDHCDEHEIFAKSRVKVLPGERGNAKLSKLNERLRFLRYQPGQYFKVHRTLRLLRPIQVDLIYQRHCDGVYYPPDRSLVSYYTLQIYLNGDAKSLEGGATRFFSYKSQSSIEDDDEVPGPTLDVPARTGRALVFEQRGLVHSGMDVKRGVKLAMRTDILYDVVAADAD